MLYIKSKSRFFQMLKAKSAIFKLPIKFIRFQSLENIKGNSRQELILVPEIELKMMIKCDD